MSRNHRHCTCQEIIDIVHVKKSATVYITRNQRQQTCQEIINIVHVKKSATVYITRNQQEHTCKEISSSRHVKKSARAYMSRNQSNCRRVCFCDVPWPSVYLVSAVSPRTLTSFNQKPALIEKGSGERTHQTY